MSTIVTIYTESGYGGSAFNFNATYVDQLQSLSTLGITLTNPFSMVVASGYVVEWRTDSSTRLVNYGFLNGVSNDGNIISIDDENFTHFVIRSVKAYLNYYDTTFGYLTPLNQNLVYRFDGINAVDKIWSDSSFSGIAFDVVSLVVSAGFNAELYDSSETLLNSYSAGTYSLDSVNQYGGAGYYFRVVSSGSPSPAPAPAPSSLPYWKRSKLNLFDVDTDSLDFHINQTVSTTEFEFPTNLTFMDSDNTRNIEDVLDYFVRVDGSVESRIDVLESEFSAIENNLDSLAAQADVDEADILTLDGRMDVAESRIVVLETRADSNAARLLVDDASLDAIESRVDALEGRADINESDIVVLEGRFDVIESDLVVLDTRADSNAARLLEDDAAMDAIESRVDALEVRADVNESDILALEGRMDVIESDLVVLDSRADSNAARLLSDDASLDAIESRIMVVDTRTTDSEASIVALDNHFDGYESSVEEVKGALYAITDGSLESTLSSLQQIRDEFEADYSAEDMVELQDRLAYLESVLEELTETI